MYSPDKEFTKSKQSRAPSGFDMSSLRCYPINNFKKAMTGRVGMGNCPRELRKVKAVRQSMLKMDLEPAGPNSEVPRVCPIQQQGIKASAGVLIKAVTATER